MWFRYHQNNSGGHFHVDRKAGLGPEVWIEAHDDVDADRRAESIGIYFNGVAGGYDCPCCGDRWDQAWDEGVDVPEVHEKYHFSWCKEIYFHPLNGPMIPATIENYRTVVKELAGSASGHT